MTIVKLIIMASIIVFTQGNAMAVVIKLKATSGCLKTGKDPGIFLRQKKSPITRDYMKRCQYVYGYRQCKLLSSKYSHGKLTIRQLPNDSATKNGKGRVITVHIRANIHKDKRCPSGKRYSYPGYVVDPNR